MKTTPSILVTLAGIVALTIPFAGAETIFSDDFNGDPSDLNGSTPDVTTGGATWVASSAFKRDGSIDPASGSATLAFTPVDGQVYTLDASVRGVTGTNAWIAIGFANGQSEASTASDRFITGNVMGTAWILYRGDASVNENQAFLGIGTGTNGGTFGGAVSYAGPLANASPGGDADLRIVLDTSGGAGTWMATWYAKRPAEASYTEVRPPTLMLTESMNSVGIALASGAVDGTVTSFSLITGAVSASELVITEFDHAPGTDSVTLTWTSRPGVRYVAKYSTDMTNWERAIGDGLSSEIDEVLNDGDKITSTLDLPLEVQELDGLFFRIEEEQ